ncbi:hypothetical protein HG536_0A04740 [Torulaspora globosa]|uniref:Chromatin target of PRMT1 protein C-terminal domain-containing protein n=1 Tax=Torulaspora globosa TaxID=48254 RepID=A0A7G3ZAX2_9SACH|nr:uncharacterized protein HG536_0A04740 [Torulaspora globosa]QLL30658.1 hypothetical protein HG536_0A04740 [Torulaspora globosa]
MANITFKNGEMAKKAVAKFNGAPIDGGRSRLRLNLIIDPTQRPARSLSERIRAVAPKNVKPTSAKKGPTKKAALAKKQKQQKPKQPKKSLEDLDKEMADYFEEKQ